MAEWLTRSHLEDHYSRHRGPLRTRSVAEYDASVQETIAIGTRFTYIDRDTRLRRIGYFHRASSRFAATTAEGYVVNHFLTDEGYVADLIDSTYTDE